LALGKAASIAFMCFGQELANATLLVNANKDATRIVRNFMQISSLVEKRMPARSRRLAIYVPGIPPNAWPAGPG
jgi:hypothetical protein